MVNYNRGLVMKESNFKQNKCWGGKRECAGRKKTCRKKVPFNRRINEDVLNILREYAQSHNMTETEALESAIILQSNVEKLKGDKIMKIVIPSKEEKLCAQVFSRNYLIFYYIYLSLIYIISCMISRNCFIYN